MNPSFEKVVTFDGGLLKAMEFRNKRLRGMYHVHPEVELVATLSGSGLRIVGDHITSFGSGDLLLIGPNLPHQFITEPFPVWQIVIQFLPEALGDPLFRSTEGSALRTLLQKASRGISFCARQARQATNQMRGILPTRGVERFITLLQVLQTLSEGDDSKPLASVGYSPSLDAHHATRVARACDFIQRRYQDPISQAEVAAYVSMSPAGFSRMFSRATGLTFTAFLAGVRVSEASRQLIETDLTIAEIAGHCGFTNLSNFNRCFRQARRMTPREFRRIKL